MKILTTLLVSFSLLHSLSLQASLINTTWRIDSLYQYNYLEGKYETPTVPTEFELTISFENAVTSSTDYGKTSITNLGEFGGTKFSSPLTQFVGTDPFGNGIQERGYTFPNVSDYSSTFFEELAFQSNTLSSRESDWWTYRIDIRARRYTESRGGTGNADYFFTPDTVNEFLNEILIAPESFNFIFTESWELYDGATGKYLDGFVWSSYDQNVTLLEVSNSSVNVTEPATFSLVFMAAFIIFYIRSLKNNLKRANRK